MVIFKAFIFLKFSMTPIFFGVGLFVFLNKMACLFFSLTVYPFSILLVDMARSLQDGEYKQDQFSWDKETEVDNCDDFYEIWFATLWPFMVQWDEIIM